MDKNQQKLTTATQDDVAWAKQIIDGAFTPSLKKMIDTLNKTLATRNIRAGLEITWYFDKQQEESTNAK